MYVHEVNVQYGENVTSGIPADVSDFLLQLLTCPMNIHAL